MRGKREPPYIVLGAWEKADKVSVAHWDTKKGMWAVSFCELKQQPPMDRGEGLPLSEIGRVYFTLYFAGRNKERSINSLIWLLQDLQKHWNDEQEGNNGGEYMDGDRQADLSPDEV